MGAFYLFSNLNRFVWFGIRLNAASTGTRPMKIFIVKLLLLLEKTIFILFFFACAQVWVSVSGHFKSLRQEEYDLKI